MAQRRTSSRRLADVFPSLDAEDRQIALRAAHEAGHVIVGHAVGLVAYRATIRPSRHVDWAAVIAGGDHVTYHHVDNPLTPVTRTGGTVRFRRLGRWRRRPGERRRQHLVSLFGGVAADHLLTGRRDHRRAASDYQSAAQWLAPARIRADGWRPDFEEPYREAGHHLREHLDAWKRVLAGLAERGTLNENEIRALINGD